MIVFGMHKDSGHIHLYSKRNFQHQHHPREFPANSNCNECDLDLDELNVLKVMYKQGVSATSLSYVFNKIRKKEGREGEFLAKPLPTLPVRIRMPWIWLQALTKIGPLHRK